MAAAKCGSEDAFMMIGESAIVAPTGEVVARAISEDDEVISHNCDLDLGPISAARSLTLRVIAELNITGQLRPKQVWRFQNDLDFGGV
jgi:predicted amidohydrolase